MDFFHRLFDTHNPDNELGPFVVAMLISIVVAVVLGGLGIASHHSPF